MYHQGVPLKPLAKSIHSGLFSSFHSFYWFQIVATCIKVSSVERVKCCAYRSSPLVRNELPWCSLLAASKLLKCNFKAKAWDSCQEDLIPIHGCEQGDWSCWCCFPSPGKSISISVLGRTAKELLPFLACEILPKILIFTACRLLIDEEDFGMQLGASSKVIFPWLDCNGGCQASWHTIACCCFVA